MSRVFGRDLRPGDVVEVWWSHKQTRLGKPPRQDTITAMRPYTGPLGHLFKEGAMIASFLYLDCGMTIDQGGLFTLIRRSNQTFED